MNRAQNGAKQQGVASVTMLKVDLGARDGRAMDPPEDPMAHMAWSLSTG